MSARPASRSARFGAVPERVLATRPPIGPVRQAVVGHCIGGRLIVCVHLIGGMTPEDTPPNPADHDLEVMIGAVQRRRHHDHRDLRGAVGRNQDLAWVGGPLNNRPTRSPRLFNRCPAPPRPTGQVLIQLSAIKTSAVSIQPYLTRRVGKHKSATNHEGRTDHAIHAAAQGRPAGRRDAEPRSSSTR